MASDSLGARLRQLELTASHDSAALKHLVKQLNTYNNTTPLPASQRLFLMRAVLDRYPETRFPTLVAESIAANYLARPTRPPEKTRLERVPSTDLSSGRDGSKATGICSVISG